MDDIEALEIEMENKIDQLDERYSLEKYEITEVKIKPRKTDIHIDSCAIVWRT